MADDQQPPQDPDELTPEQRAANAAWERSVARKERLGKPAPPMPFPPPERQEAPGEPERDFSTHLGRFIGDPSMGGMQFIDRTNEPLPPQEEEPPKPKRGEYTPGQGNPDAEPPDPFIDGSGPPQPAPKAQFPDEPWTPDPDPFDPPPPTPPWDRIERETGAALPDNPPADSRELTSVLEKHTEILERILTTLEEIAATIQNVGGLA